MPSSLSAPLVLTWAIAVLVLFGVGIFTGVPLLFAVMLLGAGGAWFCAAVAWNWAQRRRRVTPSPE